MASFIQIVRSEGDTKQLRGPGLAIVRVQAGAQPLQRHPAVRGRGRAGRGHRHRPALQTDEDTDGQEQA